MDIKPHFYDEFKCTADKCNMTCCMQWKIAVDEKTLLKWSKTFLEGRKLDSNVKRRGQSGIIKLDKNGYCPYLREGLCRLVTRFGEEMLSETCHIFPRQIHEFDDRRELSLVSCCPAVIDFWNNNGRIEFDNIDKFNGDVCYCIRNLMMDIVGNDNYDINSSLLIAFYILLDIYEKDNVRNEDIENYKNEDILREIYGAIRDIPLKKEDCFRENNELWLDIAYNYRKEGLYTEYIENVSHLAEDILDKNIEKKIDMASFEEEFAAYESLFRNYLVSEIFTNMLIPDSDIEAIVVMFEWICMEYAVMRQGIFLKWLDGRNKAGENGLTYEDVRDYIVVISRMTGYDQDDIYEYMENSFKDVIWEWSYLLLIMGGFVR